MVRSRPSSPVTTLNARSSSSGARSERTVVWTKSSCVVTPTVYPEAERSEAEGSTVTQLHDGFGASCDGQPGRRRSFAPRQSPTLAQDKLKLHLTRDQSQLLVPSFVDDGDLADL